MAKKLLALALAMAMASSFACISALAADQGMRFDGVTETITLERKYTVEDAQSAILALNKAKLTINATESGSVKAGLHEEDGLSIAVWSHNAEVVINGGYYENTADDIVDPSHVDLIYASGAGSIVINGGTFVCATPQWTLNCRDNSNSTITVKGGKFYDFNPAEAQTGEGEIIVPAGYTVKEVVEDGATWYEVVSNAKVYDNKVETLTLSGELVADGEDGAIWAKNGAKLTIDGEGKVTAAYVTEYTMAVWAQDAGTEVVINGGYYENEGDPNNVSQADLIYASKDANIVINGGTFKCATPQWTLNCNDKSNGTITVNGGKFYQFDPSNANEKVAPAGDKEIVLGEGCTVVKKGDWYEVVKGGKASITYDSTSANANEGALRFVFNVSIPTPTKTYFGAYLLPLDIFKASGVAKAIQVQYDTNIATETSFSADLVKIPADKFKTSIYAIPYIKTANGVETFAGKSASVNSALAE